MIRKYTLIILFSSFFYASAQKMDYWFYSGAMFGGPLPEKNIENSTGKPLVAPFAGFSFRKNLNKKIYFQADLAYALKGASYAQEYSRDTLIDIGIGVVPSFYNAKIGGQMKLHYLDLPVSIGYEISEKQMVSFGFYTSFLFAGYDKTNVFIQAGYGDFADFEETVNNFHNINAQDFGLSLKYGRHLFNDFFALISVNRSTRSLYSNSSENNLYHTNISLAMSYVLR